MQNRSVFVPHKYSSMSQWTVKRLHKTLKVTKKIAVSNSFFFRSNVIALCESVGCLQFYAALDWFSAHYDVVMTLNCCTFHIIPFVPCSFASNTHALCSLLSSGKLTLTFRCLVTQNFTTNTLELKKSSFEEPFQACKRMERPSFHCTYLHEQLNLYWTCSNIILAGIEVDGPNTSFNQECIVK